MIIYIAAYCIISLIVGCIDLVAIREQENYLNTMPADDIGYYIKPKNIIGIHNILLLPSLLVIGSAVLICKIIDIIY